MRKVKMGTLRGKRVFAAVAPRAAFVNEDAKCDRIRSALAALLQIDRR